MREKTLENKRQEMANVIKTLNIQIEKQDLLTGKKDSVRSSLEKIYSSGQELDIFEVTNYKNFIGKMDNAIRIQRGVIENTKKILKVKQIEVNIALKDLKVLEKLKEKQEKKFYDHYNYLEMKELDDIASTRYKRVLV